MPADPRPPGVPRTPTLPPDLYRLLVEHAEAERHATAEQHRAVYSPAAEVDDAAFALVEAAEKRARAASDALAAWTRTNLLTPEKP
jgi:hypothetical protein